MKFDKVYEEAQGATGMADIVGTDKPSSVDWVNSKGSKAKKGHIGMAFNRNAPGQKPPQLKKKKKNVKQTKSKK